MGEQPEPALRKIRTDILKRVLVNTEATEAVVVEGKRLQLKGFPHGFGVDRGWKSRLWSMVERYIADNG